DWIGREDTDFENEALLDGPAPGHLVRAEDVTIAVGRDRLRIRAISKGPSLVVIPFYFSHCLRTTMHGSSQPAELRRADLALNGVVFNGDLHAAIQYRQGPFQQANRRVDDLVDDRRLMQPH